MSKDIRILETLYLRGPSIWTYRPAIEARVDIGDLEDCPSNVLPGFTDRLVAWLPGLIEHKCSYGERGGFVRRLREGTWPAHILEHVTLELQNIAGQSTNFGKARSTSVRGVYKVVVRSPHQELTLACLNVARDLLMAAIEDLPFDVATHLSSLQDLADSRCLGPSTACIVEAARNRKIPYIRLTDGNLIQLGYGKHQRRAWTAETDCTSAIAETIACDKDLTKTLLAQCGVPVPEGQIVHSPEEAWEAAQDIGLPVVVKPSDGNHGRGVSLNLRSREQVEAAYPVADQEGSDVIVERFILGSEHRVLVVGNKVVAATRGEHTLIVGDGRSTVAELIESQLNTDPRRGEAEEFPLDRIFLERNPALQLMLERQGFSGGSIPEVGCKVVIERNGNMANDCTDLVHPDVAAAATLAARIVGLDIAGIDMVTEDISQPFEKTNGAIVEVNAGPGLLMHLKPATGFPRPVGEAIVEHLFPGENNSGRIPIVGVAGGEDTTRVARMIGWLLYMGGFHAGLACRDGISLAQRQIERADCTGWQAGQRILMNRTVDAAVFESPMEVILSEGLPYDRCDVGVVTSLQIPEALERFDIREAEQVLNVLRTQVDVVWESGTAVLNADDDRVAQLAEYCDGDVILYGVQPDSESLLRHRGGGRRAVFMRNDQIMLATGADEHPLMVRPARTPEQLAAELAAVATAWAMGISPDLINSAIESFESGAGLQ